MDCKYCPVKLENERLLREADIAVAIFDFMLTAIEEYCKKQKSVVNSEQTTKDLSDSVKQVGMLCKDIGETGENPSLDRLIALFQAFKNGR